MGQEKCRRVITWKEKEIMAFFVDFPVPLWYAYRSGFSYIVRISAQIEGSDSVHQPTLRVMEILELIARDSDGRRLADLSRELNIAKSTLVPILQTLCQLHYLSQNEGGRYQAGTALFSLGAAFAGKFPVLEYVHSQLEDLVSQLGETCYFGVLDGGQVLYLEKADSLQPLRMLTAVGHRLPAYATGIGKALLSGLDDEAVSRLYCAGLEPLTEHTVTDLAELTAQLAQTRKQGYAWEVEESTPHVRCFAVPVRKFGNVVAAISISIPLFRYEEDRRETILGQLQAAADQMQQTFEQTDAHFTDVF